MPNDPLNSLTPLDEQLVAYLDGELDAEGCRRVEELLATEADVRQRLREMERTWNLLDNLDAAAVPGQFVESTLEMVAVAASQDVELSRAEAPRRRRRRLLWMVGSVLAAGLVGFLATALFWPDPDRQLLQDLPVLENLDQFRPVTDIAFLHGLRDAGLFTEDDGESPAETPVRPPESLDQRRLRVEAMGLGDQQQLLRLKERFDAFTPDQQQRLRQLDASLDADADGGQLRQIMGRYCEWLKTLPSYARAELTDMPPAERLKAVEKHLSDAARQAGRQLGRKDTETLMRWFNACVQRDQQRLLDSLPAPQRKKAVEATSQMRARTLFWTMWQQWQSASPGHPPASMTDDDLARLREELSPKPRKRLESKPIAQQWQLVANWIRDAARQRWTHGPLSKPDDERLLDFFENKLDDVQRDRLLSMPGEEMQRALLRLYMTRTKSSEPPSHGHRSDANHKRDRRPPDAAPAKKTPKGEKPAVSP